MAVCPYCRCEVEPGAPDAMTCDGCQTPHHRECYDENHGCTLFGCRCAPPDDPKVEVTTSEVSAAYAPAISAFPVATGFGDVNAPLSFSRPIDAEPAPPPPPPPGSPATATALAPDQAATTPDIQMSWLAPAGPRQKSRLTFILLGVFLGEFGIHNFYAGYVKRGMFQLALTVLTLFYGSFVTWIWAIVEICTVDRDSNDITFA